MDHAPIVFGLIGTALILIATSKYGAAISPDSAAYMSVANNLLAGQGVTMYDGKPMLSWPPVWPALLAIPSAAGIDTAVAGRWINAIAFGLIIAIGVGWLKSIVNSRALFWIGSIAILLSEPVIYVSTWVWTEPTFILYSYLTVHLVWKSHNHKQTWMLLLTSLVTVFAILTRYIGVSLIVFILVMIWWNRQLETKRRLAYSTLLLATTVLPLILWMLRTKAQSGSPTGTFATDPGSLLVRFGEIILTWSGWLLPNIISAWARITTTVIVILSVAGLGLLYRKSRGITSYSGTSIIYPIVVFSVCYVGVLVALGVAYPFGYLDDRYLSPIYIPLVLLVAHILECLRHVSLANSGIRRWFQAATLCFGLWLIVPVADAVHATARSLNHGAGGYSTTSWRKSETIRALHQMEFDGAIYSNAPDAIYALTGRSSRLTPRVPKGSSLGSAPIGLTEFLQIVRDENDLLFVWFTSLDRPYLLELDQIRRRIPLELVATTADGMILRRPIER